MTDIPDTSTPGLFVALASVLAAIESGTICEGEVEHSTSSADGFDSALSVTVRRTPRPLLPLGDTDA